MCFPLRLAAEVLHFFQYPDHIITFHILLSKQICEWMESKWLLLSTYEIFLSTFSLVINDLKDLRQFIKSFPCGFRFECIAVIWLWRWNFIFSIIMLFHVSKISADGRPNRRKKARFSNFFLIELGHFRPSWCLYTPNDSHANLGLTKTNAVWSTARNP